MEETVNTETKNVKSVNRAGATNKIDTLVVLDKLTKNDWCITKTAKDLGISRPTLYGLIRKRAELSTLEKYKNYAIRDNLTKASHILAEKLLSRVEKMDELEIDIPKTMSVLGRNIPMIEREEKASKDGQVVKIDIRNLKLNYDMVQENTKCSVVECDYDNVMDAEVEDRDVEETEE